jgi:hypothetical protein
VIINRFVLITDQQASKEDLAQMTAKFLQEAGRGYDLCRALC